MRRKNVRVLFLMLSLLLLMGALVACSGKDNKQPESTPVNESKEKETPNGSSTPGSTEGNTEAGQGEQTIEAWGKAIADQYKGTEIKLAFATHPSTEAFQKMTKSFEELTGIKVRWEVMEQTYLKNKQLMDTTAKTGTYDVLMIDNFWNDEYVSKKVVIPLNDYLNDSSLTPSWFAYDDIVPAYRNMFAKQDGTVYGIPTAGETRFVAYRKDLFDKYEKQPPKTMDEFLQLAQFFNGKEDGLYGVAMRAQRGIHFASGLMSTMYNFSDGILDQQTGEITMNDPKMVAALQYYIDLLQNAPPDVASYTHEEAVSAFMSGKVAMWLDATAIAPWIIDPNKSQVHDKVGFVPTPEGPAGRASALAGWTMGISEHSKNKEAAWAFIIYMNSKVNSKEYIEHGGVLVRTSQFEDPDVIGDNPMYPVILEALKDANALMERGISWVPPHEKLGQLLDRVGYYGSMALSKEMSVAEAVEKAQQELEEIVKQ
ncbi:ABC transporter substrate-binding protein [Paenibacillus yanchengensis]|uniref:ABC transporter substrate-binding protein n=1 Tax=Paenibacillus yanchengensis TaxID=2035833 RepID=A0ABW4YFG9_9BACL